MGQDVGQLSKERQMDHLVSAHVLLEEEQKKQLRFWAADRSTSMASLVREAVDYYLRTAIGPSPRQLRLHARAAVGCLPGPPPEREGQPGGHGERWWLDQG
jgi:hypothetical protein